MVKSGNDWKIASSVSVLTSSYADSPTNIEDRIGTMGYLLLQSGKTAEAIEMFKLGIRLYPQSWYAYDSLGEAYAAAGQKDLAIQNYEKSISLNPKNDTGKAALAKLKGQ
jgi:tetratricopeptide (TPR) repeat protein